MVKLKHYDNFNTSRFITFSCYQRYQLLTDKKVIQIVIDELKKTREKYQFKLLGYVIMPEHVHLVIHPIKDIKLGRIVGELKSLSAREILKLNFINKFRLQNMKGGECRLSFWMQRCYDHNCRTEEFMWEKIDYCHMNPVKRKLVKSPEDWKWSSYRWYVGDREVPIDIDEYH